MAAPRRSSFHAAPMRTPTSRSSSGPRSAGATACRVQGMRDEVSTRLADFPRMAIDVGAHRPAAVAVTLCTDADGEPSFLLTRRASRLRNHAGQWALPGGRVDEGESVEEAARRELAEEPGVVVAAADVLGRLDDYQTRSGYVISPVVVWA